MGWLDSTVTLHWIRENGEFKQFVENRVRKIQEKSYIEWRHVTSADNPADLGSRGGDVSQSANLWWKGPTWLLDADKWSPNITTEETSETKAETKTAVKELFAVAVPQEDELDQLLHKCDYWKTIRITARMSRLASNKRNGPNKVIGPLTTEETSRQTKFWVKHVQQRNQETESFGEDSS